MSTKMETIEERKAEVLIKLRKYKLIEKQKYEGAYAYIIDIPQDKEKALIWCILGEATVGIAAMNTLYREYDMSDSTAQFSRLPSPGPRGNPTQKSNFPHGKMI